ncbi:DMT family transporter [Natronoglycomyces albus]|uniref:DMT family transporter n=1 Tax=Natronoglycomyces albus TaxID=2811108 RepID=A0A895XF40_9ACTN|nr:DMT family transporter [Natronoglycomyces albus]QSB04461.1 DMT family transporter [Natronoglycomyces albus]
MSATHPSTTVTGTMYALGAMIIVGSSAAVLAALGDYPTFGGQALRYAGAAIALFALLWFLKVAHLRCTRRELGRLTLLGSTGLAAFNVCYVEAVKNADPAAVGAIIGGVPVVLAIADPIARRHSPSARLVTAAMVVTAGVAIMQGFGGGSLIGLLWALGALAAEVAFTLLAVPLLPKFGPLRVSAYASALAVPLLLVSGVIADGAGFMPMPDRTQIIALLYLSVVVTAVAFVMWYTAISRLGADKAGLCAGVAPVSAVAAAWVLATGEPGSADIIGAILVGVGVVVGLAPSRRRKPDGPWLPPVTVPDRPSQPKR